MGSKRRMATPGYVMLLTACLIVSGCSSKSSPPPAGRHQEARYTVKRGDTLFRIARLNGISVGELARLNGIPPPYTIQAGQTLRLKRGQTAPRRTAATRPQTRRGAPSATVPPAASVTAPPPGEHCWIWPASGSVIEPFSGVQGGNKGIDIAGKRGQPIYAADAGRVVYAGDQLRGYGNLVMIKHDANYITAYAHNETLLVHNGQKVARGQKIATMGSSGSDRVNLHFQLRYKATAVNPQRYLPAPGSASGCK